MKKEEVFNFATKVKLLLKSLEGTKISGNDYKINQIDRLVVDIERDLNMVLPSPYDEYSIKCKYLYKGMIDAKQKYEEIKITGTIDEIKKASDDYEDKLKKYNIAKEIRNTLKNADKIV